MPILAQTVPALTLALLASVDSIWSGTHAAPHARQDQCQSMESVVVYQEYSQMADVSPFVNQDKLISMDTVSFATVTVSNAMEAPQHAPSAHLASF